MEGCQLGYEHQDSRESCCLQNTLGLRISVSEILKQNGASLKMQSLIHVLVVLLEKSHSLKFLGLYNYIGHI